MGPNLVLQDPSAPWENLPGLDGVTELGAIGSDGFQLPFHLVRDVHHEGGLLGFFPEGKSVNHLEGPERGPRGWEVLQACQVGCIIDQFCRRPMVRVPPLEPVGYHDPWPEFTEVSGHHSPGLRGVLELGIGKAGIPSHCQPQDFRGILSLFSPFLGRTPASHLTPGQVQDTRTFPSVMCLKEGAAAKEFRVVRMGHDGQNV